MKSIAHGLFVGIIVGGLWLASTGTARAAVPLRGGFPGRPPARMITPFTQRGISPFFIPTNASPNGFFRFTPQRGFRNTFFNPFANPFGRTPFGFGSPFGFHHHHRFFAQNTFGSRFRNNPFFMSGGNSRAFFQPFFNPFSVNNTSASFSPFINTSFGTGAFANPGFFGSPGFGF